MRYYKYRYRVKSRVYNVAGFTYFMDKSQAIEYAKTLQFPLIQKLNFDRWNTIIVK